MKLSIVIPAYNEEKRIGDTLKEYIEFFSDKLKKDYEIFVVLNGCKDNTLDVVKKHDVKFLDIKEAIGKGGAIIEGFKLVEGDFIGFVDADNATPARAFYDLYDKIKDNDGIIASRWIKGAKIGSKQPISRRIASRGFNIMIKILFGINLNDTQCGAKLFRKEVVKKVVDKLGITRWAFDIDLLYLMKRNGNKIIEVPTEWAEPGGSQLSVKKTVPEMFLAIGRLRLMYSPFKFVVKVYDKVFGNG
ncbi:MAG: glucosyl transferase [Nanoarchaeota archaeon]|nr:glucosyl transferase [Nanoarchaeota archaeon]